VYDNFIKNLRQLICLIKISILVYNLKIDSIKITLKIFKSVR